MYTNVSTDGMKESLASALAQVATLTAEVDRLTGYSERLNGLRERLEDSKATLADERDAAVEKVREMAKQFDVLAKQVAETEVERDALRGDMRALAESARSLTSLWVLRGGDVLSPPTHELLPALVRMNTVLARPGVRRVMEGL
jgi:chromosome segregation ATPase